MVIYVPGFFELTGIGETRFHVTLSTGVMPFGPELRAVSVTAKGSECSWLTACMNGYDEILDSQRLLDDISDEVIILIKIENSPIYFVGF